MNRILSIEKLDRYGRAAESAGEESSGYTSAGSRGRFARVRVTPEEGEPFTISGRTADLQLLLRRCLFLKFFYFFCNEIVFPASNLWI